MKLCVACEHFYISFGEEDWSNMTPGAPPSISCFKNCFFSLDGYDECTTSAFHTTIRLAEVCSDFKTRVLETPKLKITEDLK